MAIFIFSDFFRQERGKEGEMGKYVKTNIGTMPLEDYYDMVAYQNGFGSYDDMKEQGFSVTVNPESIISDKTNS